MSEVDFIKESTDLSDVENSSFKIPYIAPKVSVINIQLSTEGGIGLGSDGQTGMFS